MVERVHAVRDKVASSLGLYRTTLPGDQGHLQNFDDDTLDSVASLMALLQRFGPKKMNWKPQYRRPTNYLSNLGLGGDFYFVGTSLDIWNQSARHISAVDLAHALSAKVRSDSKFSIDAFLGRTGTPLPAHPVERDIKPSDIKLAQQMLRAEFDAAARHWKDWEPVKYLSGERRPQSDPSATG